MRIISIGKFQIFNNRKFKLLLNLAKPTLKALFCITLLLVLLGLVGHQELDTLTKLK